MNFIMFSGYADIYTQIWFNFQDPLTISADFMIKSIRGNGFNKKCLAPGESFRPNRLTAIVLKTGDA